MKNPASNSRPLWMKNAAQSNQGHSLPRQARRDAPPSSEFRVGDPTWCGRESGRAPLASQAGKCRRRVVEDLASVRCDLQRARARLRATRCAGHNGLTLTQGVVGIAESPGKSHPPCQKGRGCSPLHRTAYHEVTPPLRASPERAGARAPVGRICPTRWAVHAGTLDVSPRTPGGQVVIGSSGAVLIPRVIPIRRPPRDHCLDCGRPRDHDALLGRIGPRCSDDCLDRCHSSVPALRLAPAFGRLRDPATTSTASSTPP